MAKLQRRKCAHKACRQWFHPQREGQIVCSFECASAIGKEQTAKAREAAKQKAAQRQRTEERQDASVARPSASHSRLKLSGIKRPNRPSTATYGSGDEGKECVSCGNPLIGKSNYLTGSAIDASHYRSRGAASHLKFNVFNVHSACTRCNRQLSGNAVDTGSA
ncbi:recombination protein NinG [Enterobacter hormaechei]